MPQSYGQMYKAYKQKTTSAIVRGDTAPSTASIKKLQKLFLY